MPLTSHSSLDGQKELNLQNSYSHVTPKHLTDSYNKSGNNSEFTSTSYQLPTHTNLAYHQHRGQQSSVTLIMD
jgi:hypothetical protein